MPEPLPIGAILPDVLATIVGAHDGSHGTDCTDCLAALWAVRDWRQAQIADLARVNAWLACE
jgi:hypothetical protein